MKGIRYLPRMALIVGIVILLGYLVLRAAGCTRRQPENPLETGSGSVPSDHVEGRDSPQGDDTQPEYELTFLTDKRELVGLRTAGFRTILKELPASADSGFAWSPDGRFLGYVSGRGKGEGSIHVFDICSGTTIEIPGVADPMASFVHWSPNGEYLAIDYGTSPGRSLAVVRTGAWEKVASTTYWMGFDWLPDSRGLIIGINQKGNPPVVTEISGTLGVGQFDLATEKLEVLLSGTDEKYYVVTGFSDQSHLVVREVPWLQPEKSRYLNLDLQVDPVTVEPLDLLPLHLNRDSYKEFLRKGMVERFAGMVWAPDHRTAVLQLHGGTSYELDVLDAGTGGIAFAGVGTQPAWRLAVDPCRAK